MSTQKFTARYNEQTNAWEVVERLSQNADGSWMGIAVQEFKGDYSEEMALLYADDLQNEFDRDQDLIEQGDRFIAEREIFAEFG